MIEPGLGRRADVRVTPEERVAAFPTLLKRSLFVLLTVVLVGTMAVLSLEILLRVLDRAQPIVSGWRANQDESNRLQINQLGYRGVPITYSPDDFVVLLVGDSQVEAEGCSYYWMPERRLEHYLHAKKTVRVFSIGASGWGQDQQLLALREYYQKFRANLVIVWETPGNDLWNNVWPTADPAGRQPKPTFWLEDGQLKGPTSAIGEVISSPLRLATMYERRFVSWDRQWERRLPPSYVPMRQYSGPVKQTLQSLWEQKLGNISTDDMASEKSHQTIYLTPRSPRTQYGIDLTHRLLEEMAHEVNAHGGSFLTFWIYGRNAEVDLGDGEEAVFVLNGNYYRLSERQRSATLADINAGLPSYALPLPPGEWRYSPTDGHLNEHGVDEVMRHLAGFVVGRIGST
jgi:hypothetical protein